MKRRKKVLRRKNSTYFNKNQLEKDIERSVYGSLKIRLIDPTFKEILEDSIEEFVGNLNRNIWAILNPDAAEQELIEQEKESNKWVKETYPDQFKSKKPKLRLV